MVLAFVMSFLAVPAFAAVPQPRKAVVDVGNKICPVSGDPVSGKDFVVFKGKRYGLCCSKCKKPFLKDPKKYIGQIGARGTTSASTVTTTSVSQPNVVPITAKPMTMSMGGATTEKKTT